MDEPFGDEHYRAAWGLLVALERDIDDPDIDTARAIIDEWGALPLLEGLSIVAEVILQQLRIHAPDCGAGTFQWLEAMARDALMDDPHDT